MIDQDIIRVNMTVLSYRASIRLCSLIFFNTILILRQTLIER